MTYIPAETRYDQMIYNRCGKTGLKLPAISLGLWHNFGDDTPHQTKQAILHTAFDLGITHFDIANNYGPPAGSAETAFGRIMAEDFRDLRDEMIISSKAGYHMWNGPYGEWGSRKYLVASCDQSLKRTGLEYFDIFYSHRFDPTTPLEETMGALAHAVHSGKALYAGISSYDAAQTREAKRILNEMGVPLLIHQPRYSMFDRTAEKALFDTLALEGVGAIVFSPLAQGMLTDRYLSGTAPKGSRASLNKFLPSDFITDEYLTHARALNDIAAARGQSLAQLALTWVLRQPAVTSALIGASSVKQLEQNHAAINAPKLTVDEIAAIEPHAIDGLV